jgi:hypothetical protein
MVGSPRASAGIYWEQALVVPFGAAEEVSEWRKNRRLEH